MISNSGTMPQTAIRAIAEVIARDLKPVKTLNLG